MMRLQRVGRKNDPSYRVVVTDKRTGPKSNKHVAILGSYNPKMNHTQLDTDAAREWLAKGVQPSDTVHNILVAQKVIDAKKLNVLPKKSPIVDEEAIKKAEEEAAAKAEAEAAAAEAEDGEAEAATEDATEAADEDEGTEAASAEAPADDAAKEATDSADAEPAPAAAEETAEDAAAEGTTPEESEETEAPAEDETKEEDKKD